MANTQGLYLLDFLDRRGLPRKLQSLGARLHVVMVPGTNAHLDTLGNQLKRYFSGSCLTFDLPCIFTGSPWEQQVWRQLLTIPPGATNSYSQMAAALGRP
ncbi:MAG: methylated-DNA--[protein]-cysteine S-methyltransferase, partial [Nitrospira defluvii]|nr:methylated-DNA--[protein]-cysteine S-methyltransferase [Nitrospira defluvii]